MIYFITNKTEKYEQLIDKELFSDIEIIDEELGLDMFFKDCKRVKEVTLDIEATGLDAYMTDILLLGIGVEGIYYCFDCTINIEDVVSFIDLYDKKIIGQNLKYDIKLLYTHTNILLKNVYDTMLAEQRLYMGTEYGWGYADLVSRYLDEVVLKGIREEFIGANKDTFNIKASHLYYLRSDLDKLLLIKEEQERKIAKFKMKFLIYDIEFPLIAIIAQAELTGFSFNKKQWIKRYKEDIQKAFELECKMDNIFRAVRDFKSDRGEINKVYLVGGKYDNKRIQNPIYDIFKKDGTTTIKGLFGEELSKKALTGTKKKVNRYPNNLNYTKAELVYIFGALKEPMITANETYSIPKIGNNGKALNVNYYSAKKEYLQKYVDDRPNSNMKDLLEVYLEYSSVEKAINTYGESFVNKLNKHTGKLHTVFRQCFAKTGRFQSGGGDNEPDKPNFQNIPGDNRYRNCFTTDTDKYSIMTADYKGAELIVMCSKAQDQTLLSLSKGDMHSYMATQCWRAIYKYRAAKQRKTKSWLKSEKEREELDNKINELIDLSHKFIVTKDYPVGYRKGFKPMTFGTIYGMFAKKAGQTLGLPKEEGQIVINVIKSIIPATFKMVEAASDFAEKNGYVIFNKRTNSREWFPNLLKQLRGIINKDSHFIDISNDLSSARNSIIQGTQVDFVKEASVVLGYYFWENNIDARILSWVHDEFVIELPREYDGVSEEFNNSKQTKLFSFNGKQSIILPEIIEHIMVEVANRYLTNVTIGVDYQVKDYWIK